MLEHFNVGSLRIDERIRTYREAIQELIRDKLVMQDKIRLVEQLKLPTSLMMITNQTVLDINQFCNEDFTPPESPDYMSRAYIILDTFSKAFQIEDFFDGWDILLILAYLQVIASEQNELYKNRQDANITAIYEVLKQLEFVHRQIQDEFYFTKRDIDLPDKHPSTRLTTLEELEDLNSSYRDFVASVMLRLKANVDSELVQAELLNSVKSLYRSMEPLEDEGFNSMYDYLGFIIYHGTNHILYSMTESTLEQDIEKRYLALSMEQRLSLFEDEEIEQIAQDADNEMNKIDSIASLEQLIRHSYIYETCLYRLKREFISKVPEYDPDASLEMDDSEANLN
jgi:hypothetical protein